MKTSRLRDRAGTPSGVTPLELSINKLADLVAGLAWIGVSAWKKGRAASAIDIGLIPAAVPGYANVNDLRPGGGAPPLGLAGEKVVPRLGNVLSTLQLSPLAGTPYRNCSLRALDGRAPEEFSTW